MEYLMFYVGLAVMLAVIGLILREDKKELLEEAWEEGFYAGRDCGTITIVYESEEDRD